MSLPHARGGVSHGGEHGEREFIVFPTHVGVFLTKHQRAQERACLPHARGGVSISGAFSLGGEGSSPRTWGCFHTGTEFSPVHVVFPTTGEAIVFAEAGDFT